MSNNNTISPVLLLARFIIFQRDLGPELQGLIVHYPKVVSYDSIVIIDHNGMSQSAQLDLQRYAKQGPHVWRYYTMISSTTISSTTIFRIIWRL